MMANPKGLNVHIQGAERRARALALLTSEARPMTTQEMAAALGISESGMGYTCSILVKNGLVGTRKDGVKNIYFMRDGSEPEPEPTGPHPVAPVKLGRPAKLAKLTPVPAPARQHNGGHPREVELVIAGVLVVMGRNPMNGRMRISLEEM